MWVWVCASWHINVAHETFGPVRRQLTPASPGRFVFFFSLSVSRSECSHSASRPASSARHLRAIDEGAAVPKSTERWEPTGVSACGLRQTFLFFYYLDQLCVVFAQRYHISRAGCALTNKDKEQDSFGFAGGCSLDLALYSRRLNG